MPKNHEGRFEVIGADGCYGCHGAGDNGKTKSETAPGLPAGHYQDHSRESQTIDSGHMTCTNCHAVESDEAESNS
jgi:cytochrome c-type protein NapB